MAGRSYNRLTTILVFSVINCVHGSIPTGDGLQSRLDALENELRLQKGEIRVLRLTNEHQENTIRSLQSELSEHELNIVAMAKQYQYDMVSLQKAFTKGLLSMKGMDNTNDPIRQKRMGLDNDVAFFAKVSGKDPLHLASGDTIAFNNVVTNGDTIGLSYNGTSGVFTAPYDGLYVFSTTIKNEKHEGSAFGLFKNDHKMAKIWMHGGDPANSDTSSETVILDLLTGDRVSVKVMHPDDPHPHPPDEPHPPEPPHPEDAIVTSGYTTFAGFLLSQHAQISIVG